MEIKHGVYIITGIMAAGKSTIGQILAERVPRGVHLRGDIFRKMVVSGRSEMTPDPPPQALEQLHLRYRLGAMCAEEYFKAGFTVAINDNYLGKEAIYFLEQFSVTPVYYVTLCPSVEAVTRRERLRGKTGYDSWQVAALNEVLENENPRVGLWLDSSDLTPEQTVVAIVANIEGARIR